MSVSVYFSLKLFTTGLSHLSFYEKEVITMFRKLSFIIVLCLYVILLPLTAMSGSMSTIVGSSLEPVATVENTGSFSSGSSVDQETSVIALKASAEGTNTYPDDPYPPIVQTLGIGVFGEGALYGVKGFSNSGVGGKFASTDGTGVSSRGGNLGVGGYAPTGGTGIVGYSGPGASLYTTKHGVYGFATNGTGVGAGNYSDVYPALNVNNQSTGDLIRAYSGVGYGSELRFKVTNSGNVRADGTYASPASDLAEIMKIKGSVNDYGSGDVLVISDSGDEVVEISSNAYSTAVIGVHSSQPAFLGGADKQGIFVALTGIVPCKVSAENGPIKRADLLTTSNTPGHAMKVTDRSSAIGAILGKALGSLESGTGVIQVLVMLQ